MRLDKGIEPKSPEIIIYWHNLSYLYMLQFATANLD